MLSNFSWLREVFFIVKILLFQFGYFFAQTTLIFISSGENEKHSEKSELSNVILTPNFQ